jgi:hypothetical protein
MTPGNPTFVLHFVLRFAQKNLPKLDLGRKREERFSREI